MNYSYHGIGIRYYGQRDFRPDGSCVTTRWFCVFYLPLVPLKSIRIRPTGTSKYYSLRRVPVIEQQKLEKLSYEQVFSTYAYAAAGVALLSLTRVVLIRWLILPAILWAALPSILSYRAREEVKRAEERRATGFGGTAIE